MTYPSIDDYLAAMQAHAKTIRDPLLKSGSIEMNSWGTPLARSGTFALTFKITAKGRDYAFRCFQRDRPGMHQRYAAIHDALNQAPLPYFVDFAYLDPGIAVNGQTYPAIRMDWADGQPLGAFIEANLRDTGRLRALLQQLHGMALALEGAGIAHGDVQSNNILVAPSGEIKLVDYDGMYVPSIGSMGALETGHRNFQHPQRESVKPFDATLDRFSFALLHASVSALIENPSTWTQLKADPEAFLLRATDFANPAKSSAFDILCRMPASGPAFQRLRAICAAPYRAIPAFTDFLAGRSTPTATASSTGKASGARKAAGSANASRLNQQRLASLETAHSPVMANARGRSSGHPNVASLNALPPPPPLSPPPSRMSRESKINIIALVGGMSVLLIAALIFSAIRSSPSSDRLVSGIPIAEITTCIEGKEVEKSCNTGSDSWAYDYCWNAANVILERLEGGKWNRVGAVTGKMDLGICDSKYPYRVDFQRSEIEIGQVWYQIRVPKDSFADQFTVTVSIN